MSKQTILFFEKEKEVFTIVDERGREDERYSSSASFVNRICRFHHR